MAKQTRVGSRSDDHADAARVTAFIDRFDAPVASLVHRARRELRRRWPTAHELVYDNYNALAIGFGTSEKLADVVVSLACYASGVNLYFMYGATLPDPHALLEGAGTRGRFVRLTSMAVLADARVGALLDDAIARGRTPLPASGSGRVIVKSVSAKQRPRSKTSR